MKKLIAAVTTVLAAVTGTSYGQDKLAGTYFCNPTASGGVAYRNSVWTGTKFTLPEPSIVSIKPAGPTEYDITITTAGQKSGHACGGYDNGSVAPFITVFNCTAIGERWTINLHLLRFRYFSFGGYVDSDDDVNSGDPSVVIGTCTRNAE